MSGIAAMPAGVGATDAGSKDTDAGPGNGLFSTPEALPKPDDALPASADMLLAAGVQHRWQAALVQARPADAPTAVHCVTEPSATQQAQQREAALAEAVPVAVPVSAWQLQLPQPFGAAWQLTLQPAAAGGWALQVDLPPALQASAQPWLARLQARLPEVQVMPTHRRIDREPEDRR